MYQKLISRSPDLLRLQNDGYEMEVRSGYLLLHSIPYVNAQREVAFGILVTDLTVNDDQTQRPSDHQVWFSGEYPCNRDGAIISAIRLHPPFKIFVKGLMYIIGFRANRPRVIQIIMQK